MHNAILKYLYEQDFDEENVHFFTCTIPIKSSYQFTKIMSYIRLRPVYVNRILKYGLCFFSASAVKTAGNLCVFFKEKKIYNEYSFTSKKWINRYELKFSRREKELLVLTPLDLSREEKADTLCVSDKTVRNTITKILKKSNAKKMNHVENYANIHRLIYD